MKGIALAIVLLGSLVFGPLSTPVEAAACPNIYKFSAMGYNPSPLFGSNTLTWSQLGGSTQQVWVVERSDDNGGSWTEVQRSTLRRYMTGYVNPSQVQFRVFSTTSAGFACSPDGGVVTFDVPSGVYMVSNIIL